MNIRIRIVGFFLVGSLSLVFVKQVYSQTAENQYQTRTSAGISFEPLKKLVIEFVPEVRWDESFSVDKYLIESNLIYKPFKGFSVAGGYRFVANKKENKPTEYLNRLAFDVKYQKSFDRWKPSLRLMYTNYTEDAADRGFLKYKAKLAYNIKKCKISPLVSAEVFQELKDGEFYKMRYTLGANYKFNKKNSIGVGYKLDYYLQEYLNKHIVYIGYKYKF